MPDKHDLLKHGDLVTCSQGTSPGSFLSMTEKGNAGPMETLPMVNIPMFGMCMSQSNPQTMALTASAQGVFVAAPCVPMVVGQWLGGDPSSGTVSSYSACHCGYGGVINKIG